MRPGPFGGNALRFAPGTPRTVNSLTDIPKANSGNKPQGAHVTQTDWLKEFIEWLGQRPRWLQNAAKCLAASPNLSEEQNQALYELCLKEAADSGSISAVDLSSLTFATPSGRRVNLLSIGEVLGLNALQPRKPLELGQAPLTIVYGENGTGKSGYVRILKQVCGSRDRRPIKSNVFQAGPQKQQCTIRYEVNGTPQAVTWTPADGSIEDLREVDIFDTPLGRIVVSEENEVTYEPPVLTFLSDLVAVCQWVRAKIDAEVGRSQSDLPPLPNVEYQSTKAGAWYRSVSADTADAEIDTTCAWMPEDEEKLVALDERLSTPSPTDAARILRREVANLTTLRDQVNTWASVVSSPKCEEVNRLRRRAVAARAAADLAAREAFSGAPLSGVGSEAWRALWKHARAYSDSQAYPDTSFPVVGDDSRCVLCMQELDGAAKSRLESFEGFVRGAAEDEARRASSALTLAIEEFGEPPSEESVNALLDAASIDHPLVRGAVADYFSDVRTRHSWATRPEATGSLPTLRLLKQQSSEWTQRIEDLAKKADAFEEDAKRPDLSAVRDQRDELATRQWVARQDAALRREVARLRRAKLLGQALSLTATTGLSSKKGVLADQLVSEAFTRRFGEELANLAADRIQVELLKTRTERGHTLHRVQLKGVQRTDIGEVLSEGEFRVVALAATLADAAVGDAQGPFVFDDPISSLDQRYEEAVVRRLVELARDRQVIVFTHRLSFIALAEEHARKASVDPNVLCVAREPWGAGEPVSTPLSAKRPDRALKSLRDERLAKAAKALQEGGSDEYLPLAKGLCSDVRILLERLIEFELLADVVQRHRRAINTLGKLEKVAKVEIADCELFDRLMTKYSRYEHSQSLEAPIALPEPDELQSDIAEIVNWIESFRGR